MKVTGRLPIRLLVCLCLAVAGLAPASSLAESQCSCRYAGQSYALGTCLCIERPGTGPQYACCGMVLNNTSWQFSQGDCPVAMSLPVAPAPGAIAASADISSRDPAPRSRSARWSRGSR